jgi:hypothetical protein
VPTRVAPRLGRLLAHPRLGLALVLLVWAPLILWRAHLESNLWIDETYSLALISHEPSRVVELTAADSHPPGYYLALKSWLRLARLAGHEPGIFWARSLNVMAWLALALAAWFGGRRLAGRGAGTLIAWMVAGGAFAALHARDLRSYAFASVGVFVACLALLEVLRRAGEDDGDRELAKNRRLILPPPAVWALAAAGALLALWSHLLSAVALACFGICWLAAWWLATRWVRERARRLPAARVAATAAAVVVLGFLPWLVRVGRQVGLFQESAPAWMTPATVGNLLAVFTFWLPYGRIGTPGPPENPTALTVLGAVAAALPVLLALAAALARRPEGVRAPTRQTRFLGLAAAVSLGGVLVYVVTLWSLDRWAGLHLFHGPRYPSLLAVLWGAGLALLAAWSARRLDRGTAVAALALLPLLACSMIGQAILAARETSWGLVHWKETAPGLFPAPGEPLYVLPSELLPFYRRSLSEYDLRRIEELPCGALEADQVTVLDLNPWPSLDRPRDRLARHFLRQPGIARSVERRNLPEGRDDVRVIHLTAPSRERFRPLCPAGFASRLARELSAAAAVGLPEAQGGPDWSWLEIGDDLTTGRWAARESVQVSFDRGLPAGEYLVHLVGERQPFPAAEVPMRLEIPTAGWSHRVDVGVGGFHLTLPITLERPLAGVALEIEHPTWSPRAVGLSGDDRTLGFMLRAAWFERR